MAEHEKNSQSAQGACASGVLALKAAAHAVELGDSRTAVVTACEFPSRLFRKKRFEKCSDKIDFDSHFLRWMLSDGAGAAVLNRDPRPGMLALKLKWIHTKSFSGDHPTCMRIGSSQDEPEKSYLDYETLTEAEEAGAFLLRQDVRLLPNIFDVGVNEFGELVKAGRLDPAWIDHFPCHYSSETFSGVIQELLQKPGQQIFCFVPESGRFTACYMLFEAERIPENEALETTDTAPGTSSIPKATPELARTLRELSSVWHRYRSRVFRSSLVRKIRESRFTREDYLQWMSNWIPQVREGSLWMREAIAHLPSEFSEVGSLITTHANEEQFDFRILSEDYRKAGGTLALDDLCRNAGGEALNRYICPRARGERHPPPAALDPGYGTHSRSDFASWRRDHCHSERRGGSLFDPVGAGQPVSRYTDGHTHVHDPADVLFVRHDINLYNFVIHLNRQLRERGAKVTPRAQLDFSMISDDDFGIENMPDGPLNFIDVETAIEIFTPVYQLFLTDNDFWRATNSLQLDETVGIYLARVLRSPEHLMLVNNRHRLTQLITLQAGWRLVLHGLSSELARGVLLEYKHRKNHAPIQV